MNGRERMLAAAGGRTTDRPPVWLMRQAGRYLPEYRKLRETHPFWEMVKTPDLAVEVTLQPIRRFGMDAAILFSDILTIPDAMGIDIHFSEEGPVLSRQITSQTEYRSLKEVEISEAFDYVRRAVCKLCCELHPHTAVIGFAGAPFTLAAYMVAGKPSQDLDQIRMLADKEPDLYHALAGRIADTVTGLLRLQIEAGADVVQIFDTWAGRLSEDEYRRLALPYSRSIIEGLRGTGVPIILYLRNSGTHLDAAAASGCHTLSIDSTLEIATARARLNPKIALQGNFDPDLLHQPPEIIRQKVRAGIRSSRGGGYIANLGQGLNPQSPIDGVAAFVQAVQEGGA